jgi:multiple sugar transport system ATP-binding protein
MTVRASGEVGFKHGETIDLTPQLDKLHKFDAAGLRI